MSLRSLVLLSIVTVYFPLRGTAQTIASDEKAVMVLSQSLTASGAGSAASPDHGFIATGTITYFWAGQRVQGAATIRARGHDQFRLDGITLTLCRGELLPERVALGCHQINVLILLLELLLNPARHVAIQHRD